MNKKENTTSCCLTLFIYGGPCHLYSFKQCCGTLFSSENRLFINWWEKSLYYYVIYIVNVKNQSLNFVSKLRSAPLKTK